MKKQKLIASGSTNAKQRKTQHIAKSFIMYLSPHKANSYGKNVCGHASPGCIDGCLNTSGMGSFSNVQNARIGKTDEFFRDTTGFLQRLYDELFTLNSLAAVSPVKFAVRLNGTSDLDWPALFKKKLGKDVLAELTNLQFYDYTKNIGRAISYLGSNYHLTVSRDETNNDKAMAYLRLGGNVAMVFNNVPDTYMGFNVIDGDESDLRYMDPENVIIGLKAKGKAKKDTSGFVIKL